jgi:hypothetical protein
MRNYNEEDVVAALVSKGIVVNRDSKTVYYNPKKSSRLVSGMVDFLEHHCSYSVALVRERITFEEAYALLVA